MATGLLANYNKAQLGTSTTGAGMAVIMGAVTQANTGHSWQVWVPMLVAGLVLLAFPQNTGASAAAANVVSDIEQAAPVLINAIEQIEALKAALATKAASPPVSTAPVAIQAPAAPVGPAAPHQAPAPV